MMRKVKLLVAATCATTVVGVAGAAHADDGQQDANFLQALKDVGIPYQSADKVTASGEAVCSYLHEGHTPNETAQTVASENNLSSLQAAQFVALARGAYCPLPPMGGGGGG